MKKAISLFIVAVVFVLSFSGCGSKYVEPTQAEIDAKIESGDYGVLYAHYSVNNTGEKKSDFYVQFDSSQKDLDYYDAKGTRIEFYGERKVYDAQGNIIDESKLSYGDALLIVYDHEVYGSEPVTIKAIKVSLAPKG